MRFIRKTADFLLSTYLFIATAAACFIQATYFLTGRTLQLTALTALAFFSTILIYNFHKVSSHFSEAAFSITAIFRLVKNISRPTKTMMGIAITGIIAAACFVQPKTLLSFLPLALVTFSYSIPVLKVNGKRKRLREIFLVKITTLSLVWSFSTVTIPLIDGGMDILSPSSLLIFTERFLFMVAICIPFEIRDMKQEKKWGNTTLPLLVGVKRSKLFGILLLFVFIILVFFQYDYRPDGASKDNVSFPLYISAIITSFLILFSDETRSKYYFRIFVDGMMQLQFILLLLFSIFP